MPVFQNMLGVLLFVISPILIIIKYFLLLGSVDAKVLFLYFTFTMIHSIIVSIWFFVVLLPMFEGLKRQNASERTVALKKKGSSNDVAAPINSENEPKPTEAVLEK